MPLISIATATIPGWQGNTSGVSLRIYANANFTAQTGTIYPKSVRTNAPSLGTFYQSFGCTVSGSSLVIPAITLDSTVDSPDNPSATYSAQLWDGASGKPIQQLGPLSNFTLPSSPTSTTWAAIFAAEASL